MLVLGLEKVFGISYKHLLDTQVQDNEGQWALVAGVSVSQHHTYSNVPLNLASQSLFLPSHSTVFHASAEKMFFCSSKWVMMSTKSWEVAGRVQISPHFMPGSCAHDPILGFLA